MHLEKLFRLYLDQAKHQALTLLDNDRRKACQWIKNIELAAVPEEQDKVIQLHALKLLLLCLESNCFTGPFEESPVDDKEFTEYDWNLYPLKDFSNMIRSKKDARKRPDVSYAVSGNRRELVTYQDDPATGQHCYYACSREPVEEWENLEGGAIHNESINNWRERGELEELNQNESQNSSIDVPRCARKIPSPEVDFCVYEERKSDLSKNKGQRMPNSANKSLNATPAPSGPQACQRIQTERPETPLRFGGTVTRPYGNEEFGLSQNEQFRSPRRVLQNFDYDQFQTHRCPMAPRLTDEIIDSFEYAKARLAPLSEEKNDSKKQHQQQLCVRLQKIRNEMNQKPQVEVEQQVEGEPESFHYEPITLQEPCDEIDNSVHNQVTGQDLSILTTEDMDDEDMFGEQQTIDPRKIFKTKDENLVSRNVVKIETNTTISGSKREVTEEIFEEEDVNVQERTEADENLVDVSEPVFESPPGYSPLKFEDRTPNRPKRMDRQTKPRRIPVDYSDLPQENLEDISQPSFQHGSFNRYQDGTIPHNLKRVQMKQVGEASQFIAQPSTISEPSNRYSLSQRGHPQVYESEILDDVSQPDFSYSLGNSKCTTGHGPSCYINDSEKLEDVCQPDFPSSFEDSSRTRRAFPELHDSERLDNISQPTFPSSFENSMNRSEHCRRTLKQGKFPQSENNIGQPGFQSYQESTIQLRRSKCPSTQRPEMLVDVCQPDFQSLRDSSNQSRRSRGISIQKSMPNAETSERLDDVSYPSYQSTLRNSTSQYRRSGGRSPYRRMPDVETSEKLDEVSQPGFASSIGNSTIPSRAGRSTLPCRNLPQVHTSERLDQVSHPGRFSSIEEYYQGSSRKSRSPQHIRHLPQVETSERLDQVSQPGYESFKDSTIQSSPHRRLPLVGTSERLNQVSPPFGDSTIKSRKGRGIEESEQLCDVSQPTFQSSYKDSKCRPGRLTLKQTPMMRERLDDVSQPDFAPSCGCSMQRSGRRELPPLPVDKWELEDVSQPNFQYSNEDSKNKSAERRCLQERRAFPYVDVSERLDSVCQPDFPSSVEGSMHTSGRNMCAPNQRRPFPQIEESVILDDVDHPDFSSCFQQSSQGFHSKMNASEVLEDVSQPIYHSSFENSTQRLGQDQKNRSDLKQKEDIRQKKLTSFQNSMPRSRCMQSQRPLPQVNESERLNDVVQPDFQTSFENSRSRQTSRLSKQTQESRPQNILDASERLNEVSQPFLPTSFEDSTHISGKLITSPRELSNIDKTNKFDKISPPTFHASLEESSDRSRRSRNRSMNRPFHQVEKSEILEDISQPTCFAHSTALSSGKNLSQKQEPWCNANHSERLDEICQPNFPSSFEDSNCTSTKDGPSVERRIFSQTDGSQRLKDISQPDFATSIEDSVQNSRQMSKQANFSSYRSGRNRNNSKQQLCPEVYISERLDDVCQPEFPTSFEDSKHCSRRNKSRHIQKSLPTEILVDVSQPDFSCSFDRSRQILSDGRTRRVQEQESQFNPCEMSGRNRNTQKQRYFPDVDISERLDDVCQPEFPTSFEDSKQCSRRNKSRPTKKSFTKEILEDVDQPDFACSLDRSTQRLSNSSARCLREQRHQVVASEILDDVIEPDFPSTFQDYSSLHRSGRKRSTPLRRFCPEVENSERLDDVCQPQFPASFEDSRRCSQRNKSRPLQKSLPSEILEHITQPDFSCSLDRSKQRISDKRATPHPQQNYELDASEMLEDVVEPDYSSTFQDDSSIKKSRRNENLRQQRYCPEIEILERLDDVSQPEFPTSFEDSRHCSGRNKTRPMQKTLPREMLEDVTQPNFSCSLDYSRERSSNKGTNRLPEQRHKIDDSVMLEDIIEPEFPSTIQESMTISSERRNKTFEGRPMPQIDVSENIESVCQPELPISFDDSENGPSTYRKNYGSSSNIPEENLENVSAPTFHSDNHDPMPRNPHLYCLPAENLDDISCPSFQSSQGASRRRLEDHRSRGPKRQIFPKQKLTIVDTERLGDYRQGFQSMPNYAPFEEQIVPNRNPIASTAFSSRLKMPGTFGQTIAHSARNKELRDPEIDCPHHKIQPPQLGQIKRGPFAMPYTQMKTQPMGDFCSYKLRPPTHRSDANPCKVEINSNENNMRSGLPAPTASSTRIGLPGRLSQTKIKPPQQRGNKEMPSVDQERLVKKSSVKFHITKSTYSKNQRDKSKRNQTGRR